MTKNQILQLRTNSVLKPELVEQIIMLWDTFSLAKQSALSELLGIAESAHEILIQQAIKNNPNFSEDLEDFTKHHIGSTLKNEENEERVTEEVQLEKLIESTN